MYFSYDKTCDENKRAFRILVKQYHPDKPTGNEEIFKAINNEWEYYNNTRTAHVSQKTDVHMGDVLNAFWDAFGMNETEEDAEEEVIMFMGILYIIDDDILRTIALRHGGIGLTQFVNSKEWQAYLNRQNT